MGGGLLVGLFCLLFTGGNVVYDEAKMYNRRNSFHIYPKDQPQQYAIKNKIISAFYSNDRESSIYNFPNPLPFDFDIEIWSRYKAQELIIAKGFAPFDYYGSFDPMTFDPWKNYRDFLVSPYRIRFDQNQK